MGSSQLSEKRPSQTETCEADVAAQADPPSRTPLPKLQLLILFLIQLAEPVVSKVIFPFVNQFVRGTGIIGGNQANTGYYSGLIESCFYATEALCVLWWGRASDRFGRKPILLTGLFGLAISTIGFGLSQQFWSAVLARCAEGALCGNIGVAKSTLAELTDSTNIAIAFSFLPMVWAAGGTLSPIIGGVLANPAQRWPNTIGRLSFFRRYPYFLPCIAASCFPFLAVLVGLLWLKETRPRHMRALKTHDEESAPSQEKHTGNADNVATSNTITPGPTAESVPAPEAETNGPNVSLDKNKPPTIRSLLHRRLLIAVLNYGLLAFFDQSMAVLIPLLYSTEPSLGGLNFSSFNIGIMQGVWGICNGTFNIVMLPRLLRRFGVRKLYIASAISSFISMAMFPAIRAIGKQSPNSVTVGGKVWAVIVVQLLCWIGAYMGYGCIFVFINDGAPDNARGTINGIAQMTVSIMRAVAPIMASSLLSVSLASNLAGGDLFSIILCFVAVGGIFTAFQLPKK